MTESTSPAAPQPTSRRDELTRYGLVAVILIAILGTAYIVSEQAGLDLVGDGGVNAQLIPKVGEEAPELIVFTPDGQYIPLSALRGYPVWLNFWGSWCQPCRAEMPEVIDAYDSIRQSGVLMLGVNMRESGEDALNYANTVGINFPIVFPATVTEDELKELKASGELPELVESAEAWQINNFPTHIFIDADGIVRSVVLAPLTYETAMEHASLIAPGGQIAPIASPQASPVASPEASPVATPAA